MFWAKKLFFQEIFVKKWFSPNIHFVEKNIFERFSRKKKRVKTDTIQWRNFPTHRAHMCATAKKICERSELSANGFGERSELKRTNFKKLGERFLILINVRDGENLNSTIDTIFKKILPKITNKLYHCPFLFFWVISGFFNFVISYRRALAQLHAEPLFEPEGDEDCVICFGENGPRITQLMPCGHLFCNKFIFSSFIPKYRNTYTSQLRLIPRGWSKTNKKAKAFRAGCWLEKIFATKKWKVTAKWG